MLNLKHRQHLQSDYLIKMGDVMNAISGIGTGDKLC